MKQELGERQGAAYNEEAGGYDKPGDHT
jgi:hypothetical protein